MKLHNLLKNSRPSDLEVMVDNLAALENVSRFLCNKGYTVGREEEGALWRIRAHMDVAGSGADESMGGARELQPQKARMTSAEDMLTLVMISAPVFGSGDDELGSSLMKSFLATLPEMGSALWRIILLNGGVTLTAESSPVLDQLQALEKSGVSILVCGTCLEHFGLLSKKAVGESTNMLDVMTSMDVAHKIIRV
jgi:selenium metabolism protein YedF